MRYLKQRYYHSKALISLWKDYIDWEKRRKAENGFLKKTLEKNQCQKIFEAGLGDGCDTIHLIKEGFDVTSNELDLGFLKKAQENAREENVKLTVTGYDWRDIDNHIKEESFDSVLCLGNTLTYLFTKRDQLNTLNQFYRLLRKGGVLVIDERNYQRLLDNKKKILSNEFKFRKKYVYCGEKVDVRPIHISKNKVILQYKHKEKKLIAQLTVYPFKDGVILNLLKETGFKKIEQYSDFSLGKNKSVDFFTYVAHK